MDGRAGGLFRRDACDVVRFMKMLTRFRIDFICIQGISREAYSNRFYIMNVLFTDTTTPEIRGPWSFGDHFVFEWRSCLK